MNDSIETDFTAGMPNSFPLTVLMRARPGVTRWATRNWDVAGIFVGESTQQVDLGVDENDGEIHRFEGLKLRLFEDETESYYHNLMSPQPGCFIVARPDEESDDDMPIPFLATLSFDQAHAYAEGDDEVFAVPIPKPLYVWVEAYVLQHYAPEKKRKRKLTNWKDGEVRH